MHTSVKFYHDSFDIMHPGRPTKKRPFLKIENENEKELLGIDNLIKCFYFLLLDIKCCYSLAKKLKINSLETIYFLRLISSAQSHPT